MVGKNDVPGTGQLGLFEMPEAEGGLPPKLTERFVVPPFSILDARAGYWQTRKRAWLSLGIQSELGRGEALAYNDEAKQLNEGDHVRSGRPEQVKADRRKQAEQEAYEANTGTLAMNGTQGRPDGVTEKGLNHYRNKEKAKQEPLGTLRGEALKGGEDLGGNGYAVNTDAASSGALHTRIGEAYGRKEMTGTSIFDPVLCEVAYRWFSPQGGRVLDPFAGGSVRGIVASKLQRAYTGIDLSPHQVEANRDQAKAICAKDKVSPRWINGDSRDVLDLLEKHERYDMVFTCPPYYDLEVYSKDPRDISNAGDYVKFLEAYNQIIANACYRLRNDRFAGIVVGDIRDKKGAVRPFLQDTIAAFEQVGLRLYNTAVLITVTGSLPVRVGKQFIAGRKLGRTHQYFLTFCKGDPKRATEACGDCEAGIPQEWG